MYRTETDLIPFDSTNLEENIYRHFLCENALEFKKMQNLDEAVKVEQINIIIRRMLTSVQRKQDAIDTRDIDNSKGMLKNVKGYEEIHRALREIRTIARGPNSVDSLIELEKNLLEHSDAFRMAYNKENLLGIWTYQSCVLTLFYGTMLVIAKSIRTVKTGIGIRLEAEMSADLASSFAIQNAENANKLFKDGRVTLAMNNGSNVVNESITGLLATIGLGIPAAIAAIFLLVYFIRIVIIKFFNVRKYIAKEFKIVANFLELNAATMDNRTVARRQEALAATFNSMADTLRIKDTTSDNTTKQEIKREITPELDKSGLATKTSANDVDENVILS